MYMAFNEPSKKIQKFVNTNISLPPFKLSENAKKILEPLFNHALSAKNPNYSIVSEKKINPNADFPKSSSYHYMNQDIQRHITKMEKDVVEILMEVGNRTYRIFFIYPSASNHSQKINQYVKKIHTWLHVASQYAKHTCSKSVNVYLYFTDLKKTLPSEVGSYIDEIHVNTAFTSSCQKTTEIVLYRFEEWFKVFIHESFHNLGLDFSETFSQHPEVVKSILTIFPVKSEIRLYETYCEMWAELMNILLLSVDDGISFEKALPAIEKHIQIERKYSLFQTAKILDYFDLNYYELFEKTAEAEKLRKNYKEKTEVFCYYIIKTILLYNCNDFLEWVLMNCDGIQFNQKNIHKYVKDLIIPKYNEIKYVNLIDKIQTYFDKPRNTFIGTNLRMTALEGLLD